MVCPYCEDQVRSSGYFEIYHVSDGTPCCSNRVEAQRRRRLKRLKKKARRR